MRSKYIWEVTTYYTDKLRCNVTTYHLNFFAFICKLIEKFLDNRFKIVLEMQVPYLYTHTYYVRV